MNPSTTGLRSHLVATVVGPNGILTTCAYAKNPPGTDTAGPRRGAAKVSPIPAMSRS